MDQDKKLCLIAEASTDDSTSGVTYAIIQCTLEQVENLIRLHKRAQEEKDWARMSVGGDFATFTGHQLDQITSIPDMLDLDEDPVCHLSFEEIKSVKIEDAAMFGQYIEFYPNNPFIAFFGYNESIEESWAEVHISFLESYAEHLRNQQK